MIPFDFEFYRPTSMREAVDLFQQLDLEGKQPMYFSGGTEIITLGRVNQIYTNAVIDIKGIPECQVRHFDNNFLYLGAGSVLADIEQENPFPLLTDVSKEVADHTTRRKVTIGGNICGNIPYREAVLPFLLTESEVIICGSSGLRCCQIQEAFDGKLHLNRGEFLVQLVTERKYLSTPYVSIKRRKQWDTGYPVVTVAAIRVGQEIRVAFSGLSPFPFRSKELEIALNDNSIAAEQRVETAITTLTEPIVSDTEASAEYKLFVMKNVLLDVITALEVK
ncbi:xanthine dehydrogenase [Anaerobacillus alkaliphilus]|uniref:Xanthine dehydrogenase n=1 Tax=Anaerobacillus alkaliphilus TaxID=1548597 RepID=A0A4Q0VSB5_9BACI|nr:FAD binding domain-containing protein [Anaerobacillus alkaliphilus]RXJ00689.1 xanthine dehydrogenase [Anaerobacillus alkaliphilus]